MSVQDLGASSLFRRPFYYKAKYQSGSKHSLTHQQYLLNTATLPMPLQSEPQYRH